MKITETNKESARKKVMLKDYSLGKRIYEMEANFNEAIIHKDHYWAEYYNRKVNKLYKEAGVDETEGSLSPMR